MTTMIRYAFAVLVASHMTACSAPSLLLKKSDSTSVSLKLFNSARADDAIRGKWPIDHSSEVDVVSACREDDQEIAPMFASALTWLAKPVIKLVVEKANKALQNRVATYTAAFEGTTDLNDFYYSGQNSGPTLNYSCLRLTRRDQDGVAMDFVAKLLLDGKESIQIIPIRLYYARSSAQTKRDGSVGIAISASAEAIYRDDNVGRSNAKAWPSLKLKSAKFEPGVSPLYEIFDDQHPINAPLLPWSRYDDVKYGGSQIRIRLSVAEAGEVPWLLENVASLLDENEDDLVDLMVDAATEALAEDDDQKESDGGTDEESDESVERLAIPTAPDEFADSSVLSTDERPALPFPPGVKLETQCGLVDDLQDVETYDGSLGVSKEYVDRHQGSTVQFQWLPGNEIRSVLSGVFPGDVGGARWCSGTLLESGLVLTAGHCFDVGRGGPREWTTPFRLDGSRRVFAEPGEIASVMRVNFLYQVDGVSGGLRPGISFPIAELVEYRRDNLDYAIVRLGASDSGVPPPDSVSPGRADVRLPSAGEGVAIIQHPQGQPKKVEAGRILSHAEPWVFYNDIDTHGGSSGSGVRDRTGAVIAVHTNGGCKARNLTENDANRGVSITAIAEASDVF